MSSSNKYRGQTAYLRRLPAQYYCGEAVVHWTMTIHDRKTGWLVPIVYYKLREILTHTSFRYALACPVYCCMPDHLHLLWMGLCERSNQLNAIKYFRKHMGPVLSTLGVRFQNQPYDNVLRGEELERSVLEETAEYVARNPERAELVPDDGFRLYPYTDCLYPGHPDLHFTQPDFWDRFWRIMAFVRRNGLTVWQPDAP